MRRSLDYARDDGCGGRLSLFLFALGTCNRVTFDGCDQEFGNIGIIHEFVAEILRSLTNAKDTHGCCRMAVGSKQFI